MPMREMLEEVGVWVSGEVSITSTIKKRGKERGTERRIKHKERTLNETPLSSTTVEDVLN
jgi:hypothetical protein